MQMRIVLWGISILVLLIIPPLVIAIGQPFYLDLVRRIMILAIAAVSLNLILGYEIGRASCRERVYVLV